MSRSLSHAVVGGLAVFAALGLTASAAEAAQTAKLDYRCKFPLIGTQPLSLDITLDIPDSVPSGEPTAPFGIKAVASVGGLSVPPLEPFGEVRTIGGVTEAQQPGKGTAARARVELADGSGVNVRVPINVQPSTFVTPVQYPLVLNATGQAPSLTLDVPGAAKVVLTELILNLYGHDEDGTPVEGLATPPTDIDRAPYADIDGDPGTFNVPCKLDPATQNLQLAAFEVGHGDPCEVLGSCPNQPPSKPGRPSATFTGTDRVTLFWDQATDDRGVTGYDVFRGGTKVATVPNNAPYTVTGLAPNTAYEFRVEAFDADGARTSSDAVTVRTGADLPGRQKATVNYKCKFPLRGTTPVAFEFGLDVPDTWPVGEPTGAFPVNVRASLAADFSLPIVTEEASVLASVSEAQSPGRGSGLRLSVLPPDGGPIAARVPINYEPFALPLPAPAFWVFNGSGVLPSLTVHAPGTTRINLVAPALNLSVRNASGEPIEGWSTPPTDIDRQPYADVDGDPATFNVPCKPDPADQNMQLASFETRGEPTPTPTPTPTPSASYAVAGSVKLATLVRGSLALKGQADLSFTRSGINRTVNGTLDLGQGSGRLVALGFLPVTAKLGLVSSGAVTGMQGGFTGGLFLEQKVRIKVLEAKLFGAIPLIAGNGCQTRQLTDLYLGSPGVWKDSKGGSLSATFKISDLNGCGALNGLVSPLTAGGGNTINVTLTPKA